MTRAKRRVLNISALVAIVVAGLAIGAVVMQAGRWTGQVEGNTDRLKINEGKIHTIEETVTETHSDVQWIRQLMEKDHP